MSRQRRDDLIDLLLNELPEDRAQALRDEIDRDPAAQEQMAVYGNARDLLRAAAAEGWTEKPARRSGRLFRIVAVAAAVLLAAVSLFFVNGDHAVCPALFEPDVAFGYLREEEPDSKGRVPVPATSDEYVVRRGRVLVSPFGQEREFQLNPGDPIAPESTVSSVNGDGARIDLPTGGILFLGPLSTVVLRRRSDGQAAVRVLSGDAALVVGKAPVHVAVEKTDLLVTQDHGALLARFSPSEIVCLRGAGFLRMKDGKRFQIPVTHRLPASCAAAPQTVAVSDDELDIDWYRDLVYERHEVETVTWRDSSDSTFVADLATARERLVYLRVVPTDTGDLEISFGAKARVIPVRQGLAFRFRARLKDLGPGPELRVKIPGNPSGLKEARTFLLVPR